MKHTLNFLKQRPKFWLLLALMNAYSLSAQIPPCFDYFIDNECQRTRDNCNGPWYVEARAEGNTGPYHYVWTNEFPGSVVSTDQRLVAHTPGLYTVAITDADGCGPGYVSVYVGPLELVSQNVKHATCNEKGSIDIKLKGGLRTCGCCPDHPNFYFLTASLRRKGGPQLPDPRPVFEPVSESPLHPIESLDGTAMTAYIDREFKITGLDPGEYSVTICDRLPNACCVTIDFEIEDRGDLTAEITKQELTCTDANSGSISVNASEGEAPYTYTWVKDGNLLGNTGSSAWGLSAGTYTVVVTDKNGCSVSKSATIAEQLRVTLTQECVYINGLGYKVNVLATPVGGIPPYTYTWSAKDPGPNTGNYPWVNVNPGSTSKLTVTDVNGCEFVIEFTAKNCGGGGGGGTGGEPIRVFPNPTTGIFTLGIRITEEKETDIDIFDQNGFRVYHESKGVLTVGDHEFPIDISPVLPGAYYLKINGGESSAIIFKN